MSNINELDEGIELARTIRNTYPNKDVILAAHMLKNKEYVNNHSIDDDEKFVVNLTCVCEGNYIVNANSESDALGKALQLFYCEHLKDVIDDEQFENNVNHVNGEDL